MITYRAAFPDERARAASLVEPSSALPGDGETQCFVAVKSRPVERIIGAAFWREREPGIAFEWAMVAAMQGTSTEVGFLEALANSIHSTSADLRTTAWLETHGLVAETLASAGFQEVALRETFTAKAAAWRKLLDSSPKPEFQASPLTQEHATAALGLLAGCALSENEINHGFATATQETPSLLDFSSSAVLTREGMVCGVCLALTDPNHTHLRITALAIAEEECPLEAGVAALLRHALSSASIKELSIQRISPLDTGSPPPQPAIDHLLSHYPNTPLTRESRHGRSLARFLSI